MRADFAMVISFLTIVVTVGLLVRYYKGATSVIGAAGSQTIGLVSQAENPGNAAFLNNLSGLEAKMV